MLHNIDLPIMKQSILQVVIATLLIGCKSSLMTFQTSDPQKLAVKSAKFRGTAFDSSYSNEKLFLPATFTLNKFTPTKEDIVLAEKILKQQIEKANHRKMNQFGRKQYIHRNLNKYFRQYAGFINENGDRVIHINFNWDRYTVFDRIKGYWDDRLEYISEYSVVMDGGYRHWDVNVNLTTKSLYNLSVNGVALLPNCLQQLPGEKLGDRI
jgi:hypothetical protein